MIKTAERPRVRTRLAVWRRKSMADTGASSRGCAAVKSAGMVSNRASVSTAGGEIVTVGKGSAVRNIGVVVIGDSPVVPIGSPVMPSPAKATEVSDSKTQPEREVRAAIPNSRIRIPSRPCDHGTSVNQPWIISGNIDHFGIRRFNNDCLSLGRYLLLWRAFQIS